MCDLLGYDYSHKYSYKYKKEKLKKVNKTESSFFEKINKLFKALATLASKKRTHISKIRNKKRSLQLTMKK